MSNFTLKNKYSTNDETFYLFEHKCGLELLYVDTEDDDYTFCASFKTEPENNRGIPHILEHIILCGSDKYRIDDPFNELVKGTLFTYLNAITYSDKTIYPVSSTNKSEFEKMYKVYLDAVFSPILSKESFLKEGVRDTKDGNSGIVFNEMSSAYNDIETLITYHINKNLLEGTSYANDSGGNPDFIKDATHEEVVEFYKKNYSKSNAMLYFYGKLDIQSIQEYIEENYLKDCESKKQSQLNQVQLKNIHTNKVVNINKELDIKYYAIAYSIEREVENNKYFSDEMAILFDFLFSSDSSIATKYLKEKYDLIDITYEFDFESNFPVFSLILKTETEIEDSKNLFADLNEFFVKIAKDTFDKEELGALISSTNFEYIEENTGYKSKGLSYYLEILNNFIYTNNRDYFHLSKNLDFENLRNKTMENYFEQLLIDNVVSCKNSVFLEFNESKITQNNTSSSDEHYEFESILPYSDKYIEIVDFKQIEDFKPVYFENDNNIFYTKNKTSEITFLTLAFKINNNVKDLGMLLELIADSKTNKFSRKQLKINCDKYIGDLNVSFESIFTTDKKYDNYVIFETKFLNKYFDEALEVLKEIINCSDYSDVDVNKNKINELIVEFDEELLSDNARLGLIYSYKNSNDKYLLKDAVEGFDFRNRLEFYKQNDAYDFKEYNDYFKKSDEVKIFVSSNEFEQYQDKLINFKNQITPTNSQNFNFQIDKKECKSFIEIDSNTYTNIVTAQLKGREYSGVEEVFTSIVKNDYFNNEIRLKGGAYGYDCSFDYDMNFYMYSVDDPNYKRTLDIFNSVGEYIKNKSFEDREFKRHIIGSINSFDNFKCFYDKYFSFVISNLKGFDPSYYVQIKHNILCANVQNIRQFATNFDENLQMVNCLTLGKN